MNSNEEIMSSLCDRIMAVCNRINKRLDENVQFHSSYDGHPNLALPYVTSRCPQTGHQPWQTEDDATDLCVGELRLLPPAEPDPPYALPAFSNHADHPMDWQQLQVRDLRPPDAAPPYGMTHQFGHQYWHTPSQPSELRPLQQHTYWEQHQELVLDQPPPHHWPSCWHPPSQHRSAALLPATPPPAAISLPCNTDMRYGSVELFHKDSDESVQSRQIHYDDIVFDRLLNQDQHVEDDVLLNVEEVSHIANEIQLDLETKDAIHSSVEGCFYLSNVEASKELIVTKIDSGFERNVLDNKWIYTDTICKLSKFGESIPKIEKHFVTNKKDNGEDTSSNVVITDGGDDAIISHCSTMLDTDARLIPPRDDTSCLGIHGHVAKPLVLALNHKHNLRAKEVEGVSEALQANKSVIYQSPIESRSKTQRQKTALTALSTPTQSRPAILRIKAADEVGLLKQMFGARRSSRFAEKSAKLLQGVTRFLKKDLVIDEVQNFKRNLEESLDNALEDPIHISTTFLEMENLYSSLKYLRYDIIVDVALGVKWIPAVGYQNLMVVVEIDKQDCVLSMDVLSMDANLKIEAEEAIVCDAANSYTENVSSLVTILPNGNHATEENRDGSPEDQRLSSPKEISPPSSLFRIDTQLTMFLPVAALMPVMKGDFRVVLQKNARDVLEICLECCDPSVQQFVEMRLMYVMVLAKVSLGAVFTPMKVVQIFISGGQVEHFGYESKRVGHTKFRGCGKLGAYSSLRLQRITRRRRVKELELDHEKNLGLLHLDLHISEPEVCEWRRSTIRYAFDPRGDTSQRFFYQCSSLLRGFHLEDTVDFNRGGVDTRYLHIPIILSINYFPYLSIYAYDYFLIL